ncbi:hypothetical protein MLD52_12500 [Puniceicoccaceae bacterium K14]|nr:hypothetical protein [Puniceicoccaceae bacterium K14]
MPSASSFAILSSAIIATWVSLSFWKASKSVEKSPWPIAIYLLWIAGTAALANAGGLAVFSPAPFPMIAVLVVGTLLSISFALSPWGDRILESFSLHALIGFHAFRFLPEFLIWLGFHEGITPVQMSIEGRNWDIISPITAIAAYFVIKKGISTKAVTIAWSALSCALLINIVTVAILSIPSPFRQFHNEPANTFVTQFPFVWLPTIHVTAAIAGQVLVIRKLLKITRKTN